MGNQDDPHVCPFTKKLQQQDNEQSTHPFIAFKHFIDEQFSAITRLSSFSDLKRKMQSAREQQRLRDGIVQHKWTGKPVSAQYYERLVQDMTVEEQDEAFDEGIMLVQDSARSCADIDPARIKALYKDDDFLAFEHDRFAGPMLSLGGACYYMPETSDNLPSTASLSARWPQPSPKFLSIDWFKHSVYSPAIAPSNAAFKSSQIGKPSLLRRAFEDLLDETLRDDSMFDGSECITTDWQAEYDGPGVEWVLSLYRDGILPLDPSLTQARQSTLQQARRQWPSLANSWAPNSAEKQLSELVHAIAISPESAAFTPPAVTTHDNPAWRHFFSKYNSDGFSSPESAALWQAIVNEKADEAAKIITNWERRGHDVEDLIDDELVVEDYLAVDTEPCLWPLCEALEKSHSDLLFKQAFAQQRARDRELDKAIDAEAKSRAADYLPVSQALAAADKHEDHTMRDAGTQTQQDIGILAAMTTTHTTTLPDGSVTTKVVLKKRFADGREETTESVKVEYPSNDRQEDSTQTQLADKKKGWFWS